MTSDDYGRLIYLVVLGCAIIGFFGFRSRPDMGKLTQYAAIWGLIFLGALAAIGLWGDISNTLAPQQVALSEGGSRIEVPRARDGHYYLTLDVNGAPIRFVVDTGASGIVLSRKDASAAGIDTKDLTYLGEAMTANGPVRTAMVHLNTVSFGPVQDRDVRAWVNDGAMDRSLLGMSYLQTFDKVEIGGGKLVLTR